MNKFIISLIIIFNIMVQTVIATEYNFLEMDCVKIPLKIKKKITTSLRNKSYENEKITFIVDEDVFCNNKVILTKGTLVEARIEILMTRGFAGIPAEIFITDFVIPNIDCRKIEQPISVRGFSTAALILPIKWVLTPFPPLGSITNVMVGGNAKLTPKKTIYLNYYPNIEIKN